MFWPYMNSKITWLCSFIFTLVTVVSHTFMYHFNMASRSPWCCIFKFTLVTIIPEFLLDNTHVILKTSLIRNCLPTKITIVDNRLVLYFHMITKFILTCIHSVTDFTFKLFYLVLIMIRPLIISHLCTCTKHNLETLVQIKTHNSHIHLSALIPLHLKLWPRSSFITSLEVGVTSGRYGTSLRN